VQTGGQPWPSPRIRQKESLDCRHPDCFVRATFNYPDLYYRAYCSQHKKDGMVNVMAVRCEQEGCRQLAQYNFKEELKSKFCIDHKIEDMVYNGPTGLTCLVCNADKSYNKHYHGLCKRCFIYTYPDNLLVRNYKTKERTVADFIRQTYPDMTWIFDRMVEGSCSKRRPDIFIDLGDHVLLIEIDENQHDSYDCSCENKRLMQIFTGLGSNRNLTVIRFNPDKFIDNKGTRQNGCWYTNPKGICAVKENLRKEWANRLNVLKNTVDLCIENGNQKELNVIHLFYNGFKS
jgi:hypothetical protein